MIKSWKNKRDASRKENKKLVQKLSQHKGKHLDRYAGTVHDKVFEKIDCLDCANCCSSIPPIVRSVDEQRMAKHLGMKVSEFHAKYLRVDEDGDTVINASPCPFLQSDNKCEIYEARPKACRRYPHTDEMDFSVNLKIHAENAFYCPAVYHILRRMDF